MSDRRFAFTSRALCLPAVALLLAVMLVGHDLVMTSPVAHAAPDAMVPSHHQGQDQTAGAMTMSSPSAVVSDARGAVVCPANRVAKAPTSIVIESPKEAANAILVTAGRVETSRHVAIARDEPPRLPAATRRALLQVFLM